jgi:hypothetical protein
MKKFLIALALITLTTLGILVLPNHAYAQSAQIAQSPQATKNLQPKSVKPTLQPFPNPTVTLPPFPIIKYVRRDVYSPEGQKALVSLEKALKAMKALGCQDPKSWYFQGAIHSVPLASNFTNGNPLCPIYISANASNPTVQNLLNNYWRKCSHYSTKDNHFLTWHRLYLYHFEQIVRQLSGDSSFAMPYWNYTNTSTSQYKLMPKQFGNSNNLSSLYDYFRLPALNAGNQITNQSSLIIGRDKAYQSSLYQTFNSQIESVPHNTMHGYIGGTLPATFDPIWQHTVTNGHMGYVEAAGFDPIFWMHHSNIDRYWESWTQAHANDPNAKVTVNDLNGAQNTETGTPFAYNFYNGQGNPVSYTYPQVVAAVYNTDYQYDKLDSLPAPKVLKSLINQEVKSLKKTVISSDIAKTQLTDEPTTVVVPLSTASPSPKAGSSLLAAKTLSPLSINPGEVYELEVKLSFQGNLTGTRKLYLNLPSLKSTSDKETYFVGSVSFFEPSSQERMEKTILFDISDELAAQVEKAKEIGSSLRNNLRLTVLKEDGASGDDITIENVALNKWS